MPVLLGFPALIRFLIGLIPLAIGYFAKFLGKIVTRNGLMASALIGAILSVVTLSIQLLADALSSSMGGISADFGNLMSSVLPDGTSTCITVIMTTRIAVFVFDIKDRLLGIANKVI